MDRIRFRVLQLGLGGLQLFVDPGLGQPCPRARFRQVIELVAMVLMLVLGLSESETSLVSRGYHVSIRQTLTFGNHISNLVFI
jgi:hypothetical protein